ncbi:MAG: ATP-binding protein [Sandaracinaceae bacterium]
MSPEAFDLLETPIAFVEADAATVRWGNQAFRAWSGTERFPASLVELVGAFAEKKATRSIGRGRAFHVDAVAPDANGRERWVRYRMRPVDEGWLIEGSDESHAQIKQALLESNAAIIEKNNRQLAMQKRKLDRANSKMRRVLDAIDQALFVVERTGRVGEQRSARCDEWFGDAEGLSVGAYLARFDPDVGPWFEMGLEACFEDLLPIELNLEQLPRRMHADGVHLELTAQPIRDDDGALEAMLVVVTDVTSRVDRERAERQEKELVRLAARVLRDGRGTELALEEIADLLERLREDPDAPAAPRLLHTVKGNAAQLGLDGVAGSCHALEQRMVDEARAPTVSEIVALQGTWEDATSAVRGLLAQRSSSRAWLSFEELDAFHRALDARPRELLQAVVMSWCWPSARQSLELLAEHATGLAGRLGKGELEIHVRDGGVRLPERRYQPLWAVLTHAVRNAVDHGIESPEARAEAGKPAAGSLWLSADVERDGLVIRVADDGRGIDWDSARRRLGPDAPREALLEALFDDGFTTREEVTETSGRGMGLPAIRDACRAMGGDVVVVPSEVGATLEIRIPDAEVAHVTAARRVIEAPPPVTASTRPAAL